MVKSRQPEVIPEVYIRQLKKFFVNHPSMIQEPADLSHICVVSKDKAGNILGWEVDDKVVNFLNLSCMGIDELGKCDWSRKGLIEYFSYHFQPVAGNTVLRFWRIDYEWYDLHANLDGQRHVEPDDLPIDINNFNLYLALTIGMTYTKLKAYPFSEEHAEKYRSVLKQARRKLDG